MNAPRKAIFALCLIAGAAFSAACFAQAPQPAAPEKPAPAPAAKPPKAAPEKLIDINTASTKELRSLTGIGDARAAAIVKGRPYRGKDELVQKGVIPQAVYDGIKDKIIAKQK
jgi:competence protein ComEA